jgi:hypothetical protein
VNRIAQLAGTGERAHTKALQVLLNDNNIQWLVLHSIAQLTPGLSLRGPMQVRFEDIQPGGATPDLVLESSQELLFLESKLKATLTPHQRKNYLKLVENSPHTTRALIFITPDKEATRYEPEIAAIAGCDTLREAQIALRSRRVFLHILTWGELADSLAASAPRLQPESAAWVNEFVDYIRRGPAGEGPNAREVWAVTPSQAANLADPYTGFLVSVANRVVLYAEEQLCALRSGYSLALEFEPEKRPPGSMLCIEAGPARLMLGVHPRLARTYGRSPVWMSWNIAPKLTREAEAVKERLQAVPLEVILEQPPPCYVLGVPLVIPPTPNIESYAPRVREILASVLDAVGCPKRKR